MDGLFGDISATELIGIVLFVVYVIWAVYAYTTQILIVISQYHLTLKQKKFNVLCVLWFDWTILLGIFVSFGDKGINSLCKVEFYQPSCWLYSEPNFLVF